MRRTYSLANLILAVTLLCIFLGLLLSKNEQVIAYLLTIMCFVPCLLIGIALAHLSNYPRTMLSVALVGGMIGVSSGLPSHGGPPMTVWQAIPNVFLPMTISGAFGAILLGSILLVVEGSFQHVEQDSRAESFDDGKE